MIMKRILSIITAGCLALLAFSCAKEEKAIFDISKATPPVLLSASVEDNVTVAYTPAVFVMDFNKKMPVYHTLALVSVNGEPANITLTTKNDGSTLTLTGKSLTNVLRLRGFEIGAQVPLELVVRGSIQDPSRGITNGAIDSKEKYSFTWTMPEEAEGSPYEEYTENSTWSLIGSMEAYGISWDGDLNMWTDGNGNHVAAHVTLKAGDEVKFRKDQAWTVNMGGTFESLGSDFAVTQDGPNIKVGMDGVYDLFLDENAGSALIVAAYDPYPDFTEASNWSVIGSLKNYDISWNGDLAMISDGSWHVALSVILDAEDEFKFRQDKAWTVNLGGEFGGLDNEFEVTQDGPNIKVGAAGTFDLFVNPEAGMARVSAASGAKVSTKIESAEPPVETVTGWNVIGLNGDWEKDVLATEEPEGVWTAYITAQPAEGEQLTEFKWRKDGGWDENYGAEAEGFVPTLGEPFAAVAGGQNIKIGAGFYKVVLNLNDMTITVNSGDVYSLIGEINGDAWTTDIELTDENGVFTSPVVYIGGGFKIRHNHSWADPDVYGAADGFTPTPGEPFTAVQPGNNIAMPEAGNYQVKFVPATAEVTVSKVDYELPDIDLSAYTFLEEMAGAETWGIIGPAVSDWSTDVDLQKVSDDPEIWAAMNVPFQKNSFKFRGNDEWGPYDLGGGTYALNTPIEMTKGGGDMTAERGVYTVFLYPTYGIAYLTEGTGEVPTPEKPEAWSLIGTVNGTSWDTDFDLTNVSGDIWKITNVAITESDEFKLRADHNWDTNVGGPEENDQSIIDAGNPYGVFKPVLGQAFEVGGKNIHIGVAGNFDITFDYAAQTILIEEYAEFPTYIYYIGNSTGWSKSIPLYGKDGDGKYMGFAYIEGEFKFKPNENDWAGDWEYDGEGKIADNGGANCPAPEAGYYQINIDLKEMTYSLVPVTTIGIVGPAQAGGWGADTDMTYNKEGGYWEITCTLGQDEMKFRANDDWAINWGGSLENLTQNGGNIAVPEAGEYTVKLWALCDTKAYATMERSQGGGETKITIDGDMSDWANVQGATGEGINSVFKVSSDENNIYFYVKRTTERMADLWGGNGYHYYTFDMDGDPSTGVELWGNGPYELLLVIYPYAGSADAPAFGIAKGGTAAPDTYTVDNAVIKGVVTDSGVETEISVPRADIMTIPTTPVTVYSWSNKGGSDKLSVTCTL